MISLKSPREIKLMREAGRVVAEVLAALSEKTKPGITTEELDAIAEETILRNNAIPAFKGYGGGRGRPAFPASICASVNDEVVHGVPGRRILKEGDILSIDVGVVKDGYVGDAAKTLPVGRISPEAARLIKICREALDRGIQAVRPGGKLSDVSRAIQQHAEANGCSVVRKLVGHGIGTEMHEAPQIPNYVAAEFPVVTLKPGMTLAIEPMINQGTHRVKTESNGWTVVTEDGKLSAHFEHTVAVTREGAEVLTLP